MFLTYDSDSKISNRGFLTLLWTGIPVKPNSRQFWKGKVLSHKCRLILSNKQLLGESVLKAPHLRFTERRHVRKEHTGKISLDHGANITNQFQVGFDIIVLCVTFLFLVRGGERLLGLLVRAFKKPAVPKYIFWIHR